MEGESRLGGVAPAHARVEGGERCATVGARAAGAEWLAPRCHERETTSDFGVDHCRAERAS